MGKNRLREVFSHDLSEKDKRLIEELHTKAVEDRKSVRLAPVERGHGLYFRSDTDTLRGFLGDCDFCSKHTPENGIADGFMCLEHGWFCGWGYTCADNDYEGNAGWPEFERIKEEAK